MDSIERRHQIIPPSLRYLAEKIDNPALTDAVGRVRRAMKNFRGKHIGQAKQAHPELFDEETGSHEPTTGGTAKAGEFLKKRARKVHSGTVL